MSTTSCVAQGVSVLAKAARPQGRERAARRHMIADRRGAAVMAFSSSGKCEGRGCVTSHNNDLQGAVRREGDYITQAMMGRRAALAASIALTAFGSVTESARAANEPVDPTTSPLVQELLRRTEEKKDARVKERLDDYNRRNFKDYFDVVDKGYNGRDISENDKAIRAQLQKWNDK